MENLEKRLDLLAELTCREEQVLKLTASGQSAKEIGNALYLSPHTVNNTISNIKNKTHAQKNTELCVFYFCRKFKVSVSTALACAILLLSLRPASGDMRRCRVRVRVETEGSMRLSRPDDATY